MSNLTSDEWMGFHKNIVQKLESAFKAENPEPHVHWHFRPRYREDIKFAEEQFQDLEFAHHYNRERKMIVSKDVLEKISEEVKKYL